MSPSNPLGSDNRFHNVGVSARHQDFESLARKGLKALREDPSEETLDRLAVGTDMSELGRFMVTKNRNDIGAFRTSILLNIGITPPYMHDGSLNTSWDVMDHYNKGGEPTYSWDHKGIHFVVLNSVVEKDFWTARGMTPMERMMTVAGLDNGVQSPPDTFQAGGCHSRAHPSAPDQPDRQHPFSRYAFYGMALALRPGDPNDGCGDGEVQVHGGGLVDKIYNLWNRNPITVARAYTSSWGKKSMPLRPNLKSY